jgi:hypothetical protein
MTQICCNVTEEEYTEIVRRAEEDGSSKGRKTADLVRYALRGGEADEIALLEREIAHDQELITQLREENGFLKSSFATLEHDIATPLTRLLSEGAKRPGFWYRFRRKKSD